MAVSSIKAAKEIVGLARVANATVPEFQKMAFGAKSVGIETGQLSDILKDMSDRVGDFLTTGGGEMAYPKEKGGTDWLAASNDLMRGCEKRGIYSQDRERGRDRKSTRLNSSHARSSHFEISLLFLGCLHIAGGRLALITS